MRHNPDMLHWERVAGRYAPLAAAAVLPAILLYSSVRTFWELEQMKSVYLRNRAAAVAARLESMPADRSPEEIVERLSSEEPSLVAIRLFPEANPRDPPPVSSIWRGSDLFITEETSERGMELFRAYVPFHRNGRMEIAQLDLDKGAADFLLLHARHNILIASVSGTAIVLLSGYVVWSFRRRSREEARALKTAHLAHLGQLAAVLAHEIRNPLATIKGFMQLALEGSDQRTVSLLTPAVAEARRIERLVADLLQYGRPPEPKPAPVNWEEIARQLRAGASDPRLVVTESDVRMVTDEGMLKQILQNLTRNALEAIGDREDRQVIVAARSDGDRVVVTVDDNGPGIASSERERVFEAFYTTKPFGTGLGLPTARKLAASLGAELKLEQSDQGGLRAMLRMPARSAGHARTRQTAWN